MFSCESGQLEGSGDINTVHTLSLTVQNTGLARRGLLRTSPISDAARLPRPLDSSRDPWDVSFPRGDGHRLPVLAARSSPLTRDLTIFDLVRPPGVLALPLRHHPSLKIAGKPARSSEVQGRIRFVPQGDNLTLTPRVFDLLVQFFCTLDSCARYGLQNECEGPIRGFVP